MILKKTGATIALVLFCCILYAKEGYRIVLRPVGETFTCDSATLSISEWDSNRVVGKAVATKKGKLAFCGKEPLQPGEYIIKYGNRSIEFFVSSPKRTNEKFVLNGEEIVQKKGSRENFHFARFQNLINYGWKSLKDAPALRRMMDTTARTVTKEAEGSIFDIMLNGQEDGRYLRDNRIVSTRFGKRYLSDLFKRIEYNSNSTVINILDSTIAMAADSIKPHIARDAFKYFKEPAIMGQESIAYHIANEYFIKSGYIAPQEEIFDIKTFVLLNGKSLVGMEIPELEMRDTSANMTSLHNLTGQGKYTIIYFYTDDCATCRIETPKIVDFVNNYQDGVINVYAIYTQDYEQRWKEYINNNFYIYNPFVNWTNVWDPQIESGFHMLYNVISTPQIYLADNTGTIIGRGLNAGALKELIEATDREYDNLMAFLDAYFAQYRNSDTTEINRGIENLYLKSKDDSAIFMDIFTGLYRFLKNSDNNNFKESAIHVAKKYILGMEQLWNKPLFLERVKREVSQMEKGMPGTVAADISGEDPAGSPISMYDIKGNYKIVYIYSTGCSLCTPITEELIKLHKSCKRSGMDGIEFVAINIGHNRDEWVKYTVGSNMEWHNIHAGEGADKIHEKYYMEILPSIYLLDNNNRVIKRNIDISDLKKTLKR